MKTDQNRGYLTPAIGSVYLLLFLIGVPWYWSADNDSLVLGLPIWVFVTLATTLGIASFTAWLLLFRWPEDESEDAVAENPEP